MNLIKLIIFFLDISGKPCTNKFYFNISLINKVLESVLFLNDKFIFENSTDFSYKKYLFNKLKTVKDNCYFSYGNKEKTTKSFNIEIKNLIKNDLIELIKTNFTFSKNEIKNIFGDYENDYEYKKLFFEFKKLIKKIKKSVLNSNLEKIKKYTKKYLEKLKDLFNIYFKFFEENKFNEIIYIFLYQINNKQDFYILENMLQFKYPCEFFIEKNLFKVNYTNDFYFDEENNKENLFNFYSSYFNYFEFFSEKEFKTKFLDSFNFSVELKENFLFIVKNFENKNFIDVFFDLFLYFRVKNYTNQNIYIFFNIYKVLIKFYILKKRYEKFYLLLIFKFNNFKKSLLKYEFPLYILSDKINFFNKKSNFEFDSKFYLFLDKYRKFYNNINLFHNRKYFYKFNEDLLFSCKFLIFNEELISCIEKYKEYLFFKKNNKIFEEAKNLIKILFKILKNEFFSFLFYIKLEGETLEEKSFIKTLFIDDIEVWNITKRIEVKILNYKKNPFLDEKLSMINIGFYKILNIIYKLNIILRNINKNEYLLKFKKHYDLIINEINFNIEKIEYIKTIINK